MAESKYQGVDGAYYIVNPSGTVHTVTREHARTRLRKPGWRLAEDHEIELYLETRVQRYDRPIAEPWDPEPPAPPEVPAANIPDTVDITPAAAELAEEYEVDVSQIEGTGHEGRILVADVEAAIE